MINSNKILIRNFSWKKSSEVVKWVQKWSNEFKNGQKSQMCPIFFEFPVLVSKVKRTKNFAENHPKFEQTKINFNFFSLSFKLHFKKKFSISIQKQWMIYFVNFVIKIFLFKLKQFTKELKRENFCFDYPAEKLIATFICFYYHIEWLIIWITADSKNLHNRGELINFIHLSETLASLMAIWF